MMRVTLVLFWIVTLLVSCHEEADSNRLLLKIVPLKISGDEISDFEIHGLNGTHAVAVDELQIANSIKSATSMTPNVEISRVEVGRKGTFSDHDPGLVYVFSVHARGSAKIKLEFRSSIDRNKNIRVYVMKSPIQTKP